MTSQTTSFFDIKGVEKGAIQLSKGEIPFGFLRVTNPNLKIGGAYGTWGDSYNNSNLPALIEDRLGEPLPDSERLNLKELGFVNRHHIPILSSEENIAVEVEIGAKFLTEAIKACNWSPNEVEGLLIGMSAPITEDYLERIAKAAGIPDSAIKVAVHKACDGSVGSLHLALNPDHPENKRLPINIAEKLFGKKVLVGGIEGLSRFMNTSRDTNALQLFGNAAGVIGVIPGETMKFIAGSSKEVYDDDGVLQVAMYYPHTQQNFDGASNVDIQQLGATNYRIAGLMHQPANGSSIVMAGPMGMVKLFVRTGVQVVTDAYEGYQTQLAKLGQTSKTLAVAICHHANYKFNKLKEKQLQGLGISLPMPWLLSEFGNVSAASNMIAFLRQLPSLNPLDHVLIDGFGAGTYYDVIAAELGA